MHLLRPSRRSLVLLLTMALLALAAPANAALPSSTPTQKLRCANGKTAKAWATFAPDGWEEVTSVAADNPCKGQWVRFDFQVPSETQRVGRSLMVAPSQRLNWDRAAVLEWGLGHWEKDDLNSISLADAKDACVDNYSDDEFSTNYDGILFFNAKDVRSAGECDQPVPKYSATHFSNVSCPSGDPGVGRENLVRWKTEGKKVAGVKVANSCFDYWIVAWWKLDNGRTAGMWIGPHTSADLWKSDFAKLPVKTKDGQVRVMTLPETELAGTFGSNPKDLRFYYNGLIDFNAGGDTVRCHAGKKSC
jgi:hypothetical protein